MTTYNALTVFRGTLLTVYKTTRDVVDTGKMRRVPVAYHRQGDTLRRADLPGRDKSEQRHPGNIDDSVHLPVGVAPILFESVH